MTDVDDTERGGKRPTLVSIDGSASPPSSRPAADDSGDPNELGANDDAIRLKINKLEQEHRDLDVAINTLEERMPYDRLTIQRLKKRKLVLKDHLTKLHALVLPDIIA